MTARLNVSRRLASDPSARTPHSRRPPVAVIAWTINAGRSAEIALAVGGESRCFYDLGSSTRKLIPVRYLLSAVRTVGYLARRRPRSVVATTPPAFPGLIAYLYSRFARVPVVLDSHPSSFDPKAHRELACQLPLHRWLTKRVTSTLVTGGEVATKVCSWGGRAIEFHEAPPSWRVATPACLRGRPTVLCIGVFGRDEPIATVLEATRSLAGCDVRITGDVRRAPAELIAAAPPNVEFTGYLRGERYRRALEEADIVLSLTDRAQNVSRASCEAVYALRPLVTSDWALTRELFPYAIHVGNDASSIASGLRAAVARHDELVGSASAALELQRARFERQLAGLRSALKLPGEAGADATPLDVSPSLSGSAL